jgi:hypothetical protein
MMMLFLVILAIQSTRRLQGHPSKLIQLVCAVEAAFCQSAMVRSPMVTAGYFTCYLNLPRVLNSCLYIFTKNDDLEIVLKFLVLTNELVTMYLEIASLFANLCLCHDIITTLNSPLESPATRMWYYKIFTLFTPLTVVMMIWTISGFQTEPT